MTFLLCSYCQDRRLHDLPEFDFPNSGFGCTDRILAAIEGKRLTYRPSNEDAHTSHQREIAPTIA
jgi:hypothetical protein